MSRKSDKFVEKDKKTGKFNITIPWELIIFLIMVFIVVPLLFLVLGL